MTKKHVDNFYNDVHGKLIPIKTEMIVYDRKSMIAGTFDILFYNIKSKNFKYGIIKQIKILHLK